MICRIAVCLTFIVLGSACAGKEDTSTVKSGDATGARDFPNLQLDSIANETQSAAQFQTRSAQTRFTIGGQAMEASVSLSGGRGVYRVKGQSTSNAIKKLRIISAETAEHLADEVFFAESLRVSKYFTKSCRHVILGDFTDHDKDGRFMWCTPDYSRGAKFEGLMWTWSRVKSYPDGIWADSVVHWNGVWE